MHIFFLQEYPICALFFMWFTFVSPSEGKDVIIFSNNNNNNNNNNNKNNNDNNNNNVRIKVWFQYQSNIRSPQLLLK